MSVFVPTGYLEQFGKLAGDDRLIETARSWLKNATEDRQWIIRHALRYVVKQGNPAALAVLGFGETTPVSVHHITIAPKSAVMGGVVWLDVVHFTRLDTKHAPENPPTVCR